MHSLKMPLLTTNIIEMHAKKQIRESFLQHRSLAAVSQAQVGINKLGVEVAKNTGGQQTGKETSIPHKIRAKCRL
jgi:hypothetical protein